MKEDKSKLFSAIFLATQLGFLITFPLIGFAWIGRFLDKKFQTSPVFLLIFIALSLILIFFEVRSCLLPFLRNNNDEYD